MTTHDPRAATDAEIEELKILLPPEIGRYDNDAYQATLLRAYVPGVLAAIEKECEWRGLLVKALTLGFTLGTKDRGNYRLVRLMSSNHIIEWSTDHGDWDIPPQPKNDATVAKIKEAVNG